MAWGRFGAVILLALAGQSVSGCAMAPAPLAPEVIAANAAADAAAEADPNALPASLEALALSAQQRTEVHALLAELRSDAQDSERAARSFIRASVPAIRHCEGDSPSMGFAAERVIRNGNALRAQLLNSIDALHRILTPRQRRSLVKQLLDDDTPDAREDGKSERKERNEDATRAAAERLDLSLGQMLKLVLRLATVQDDFEDQLDPWREPYRDALKAFRRDGFSIREHKLARIPAAKLVVGSVRKAVRVAVPLLEPQQCQAVADMLQELADPPADP